MNGKQIRLFRTNKTRATYVGSFTTGNPASRIEEITDLNNTKRQGIIFNLLPVEADMSLLPTNSGQDFSAPFIQEWKAPDWSQYVVSVKQDDDREVTRDEFELQTEFGDWLTKLGRIPKRLKLSTDSTIIEPDFYVPAEPAWIVEAKRSPARGHIRTAIGQVLDYVHVAALNGIQAQPVILLPGNPTDTLKNLIASLGITLVVRTGPGEFTIVNP